jgi:hypothetical protein
MSQPAMRHEDTQPATPNASVEGAVPGAESIAEPRVRRRRRPIAKTPAAVTTPPNSELKSLTKLRSGGLALSSSSIGQLPKSRSDLGGVYHKAAALVSRMWRWLLDRHRLQMAAKRLCLCETVSLGEKRFLAIVKVDDRHFLVGGAPGSVTMLAQLTGQHQFAAVLKQRRTGERKHM